MNTSSYVVSLSVGQSDCLVAIFPLLYRLKEKGVKLPVAFPDTVCYEHHFARAWYFFEVDQQRMKGAKRADPRTETTTRSTADALPFLPQEFPTTRTAESKASAIATINNVANEGLLMRRNAKECESSYISSTFSAYPHNRWPRSEWHRLSSWGAGRSSRLLHGCHFHPVPRQPASD